MTDAKHATTPATPDPGTKIGRWAEQNLREPTTPETQAILPVTQFLPIETMQLWDVGVVTDWTNAAVSQKAEADDGEHYFAIDPEDGLEWEPTHWAPFPNSRQAHSLPGDVGIDREAAKEVAIRVSEEMFSHPDDENERNIAYGAAFAAIIETTRADPAPMIERLRIMAKQRKSSQMDEDEQESADWQGAYDWFCDESRAVIAALTPSAPIDTVVFAAIKRRGAVHTGKKNHADIQADIGSEDGDVLGYLISTGGRFVAADDMDIEADIALTTSALSGDAGEMRECPNSPSGKHQVDTSMEEGPHHCFHCGVNMRASHQGPGE